MTRAEAQTHRRIAELYRELAAQHERLAGLEAAPRELSTAVTRLPAPTPLDQARAAAALKQRGDRRRVRA